MDNIFKMISYFFPVKLIMILTFSSYDVSLQIIFTEFYILHKIVLVLLCINL